jgi:hypothetical protein
LEVAIDTTPVLGRGAVKDTFNLISEQIRVVIAEVCALKGWESEAVVAEHGLGRHFGKSFKGSVELDWSDAGEKRALVAQLVADARVALELAKRGLRGFSGDSERTRRLREARALLADLLRQDVEEEPEDGGGADIRRGTSRDRIVSRTDPQMRHHGRPPRPGIVRCGGRGEGTSDPEPGSLHARGFQDRREARRGQVSSGQALEAAQSDEQRSDGMEVLLLSPRLQGMRAA